MARPKLNANDIPVCLRIEYAFWELAKEYPVHEITVNLLASRAQCSRGSFYYHYDGIDMLIDRIIEQSFPSLLPQTLYSWLFSSSASVDGVLNSSEFQETLERLCVLVGPHSTLEIVAKVKRKFITAWLDLYGVKEDELPLEAQILFEFMSNGVLGIIAFRAHSKSSVSALQFFDAVYPEVPTAFIKRLKIIMKDKLPA